MRRIATTTTLAGVFVVSAQVGANTLVVCADGFQDSAGVAVLQIYGKVKSIPHDSPRVRQTTRIHGGRSNFRIDSLPSGKWGVMVYHDRNANGVLDHGWNRLPQESMGYSNGFVPGLLSGMPTWEKLAVEFSGPIDTLGIEVKPFSLTNSERKNAR